MTSKKCEICNSIFKSEYQYSRHKNRKVPCIDEYDIYLDEQITNIKNKMLKNDKCIDSKNIICTYCKSEFSTKGNLKNHLVKFCKQKQEGLINLQKYKDELDRITMIKNNSLILFKNSI